MRRFKSKLIVGILVTFLTTSFAGPYMYAMSVTEKPEVKVDMQSIEKAGWFDSDYEDYLEVLNRVDEENCTVRSWNIYQGVLNEIKIDEKSSSWQIYLAIGAVKLAQGNLDKDKRVYDFYKDLDSTGYTVASWNTYKSIRNQNLSGNWDNVVELTRKVRNLKAAYKNLEADLSAYNAALAKVKSTDYTIVTWNAYMVVVNANVVTKESAPAEVRAATSAILDAQVKLVPKANITDYTAALAKVKEADYTIATWKVYKVVLDANVVTVEDSQAKVDDATGKILEAQKKLVLKADLTEYNKLATLVPEHYTADTWAVYKKVLDANVVTTEDLQDKVDEAVIKLEEAKKVLAYTYGTILEISEIQNGWGKTKDGWVCMQYTAKQSSPVIGTYRVTPYIGLNCRVSANINSQKVTAYQYGTMLQILKIMNGWGNTNHGWVSMDYLTLVQG